MRILVLEPFHGGSHRAFVDDLVRLLPHQLECWTLPARHWKLRMRLAAPYFADRLGKYQQPAWDLVLASSYVDVACLRGLAPAWFSTLPLSVYFHENQFAYPVRREEERDLHFALTNWTTALAADRLGFNSRHNLDTFLAGCAKLRRLAADMALDNDLEQIRSKSVVLHPGLDFTAIDGACEQAREEEPVLLWNHRWEHDKNPELFFETLFGLDAEGVPFKLIVAGESYGERPPVFDQAEKRLAHRILHWGFAESRSDYVRLLKKADLVVSTARHEFYGISVLEAVRAGCRPLLPHRLSYPELFAAEFFYQGNELGPALRTLLAMGQATLRLPTEQARDLTEKFSWQTLLPRYQKWLTGK